MIHDKERRKQKLVGEKRKRGIVNSNYKTKKINSGGRGRGEMFSKMI